MNRIVIVLALSLAATLAAGAEEIGYVEDFALAEDRAEALKQLIPGTEDYYYYHALHYQNIEQFDSAEKLLTAWIKRYDYTPRVREILNRQALLTYPNKPQQSLEYIREQLGIQFNHQRETLGEKPNLPSELDQALIGRDALTKRALERYKNLQGFEDAALDWLVEVPLDEIRRRDLLQRLARPDYPQLAKLVVDDLNYKDSSGFGGLPIHRQLLLSQLDECLKLKPDLLNQTNFVNTYLAKLQPNADVDWRHDQQAFEAYLDRLWNFVSKLAQVHNSLKAHVLYHRLVLDRSRGIYDKPRFMAYLQLPRHVSYIQPKYMQLDENRRWPADLNADFQSVTLLPAVGDDEPLVRSYLQHFFLTETTYQPYAALISDTYLKHLFAETKIVNGLGEPEQWYSLLPPESYRTLKERVDLDFAFTNNNVFTADKAVGLDVDVKNVQTLIVKVYEINTQNFYRTNLREIDTDINLDGLVANEETTYTYDEPPLRRIRRHFDFPLLGKPGVYVVDFIGNGKSSRALVRKGRLRHLVRATAAGYVFTVLDEQNRKLPAATIWLAGHQYHPSDDGTILIPFSNNPARQPIILASGDFCTLDYFQQGAENYSLAAGIYVDREMLLQRKTAQAVVRPALYLNGTPVTLAVLEDVRLVLTSTDHDGVTTTKEVRDFKLFEDRESVYEFQVPPRLSTIDFKLQAKVQNQSQNQKADLSVAQKFSLNEIDRTEKVEALHFSQVGGEYWIELLGKTGETKADRPVQLAIKHRDFRDVVNVTLQTDPQARIALGELAAIATVTATASEGTARTWQLPRDEHSYYQTVNGEAGEAIHLPYMGHQSEPNRNELSLLELRGGTFAADRFDALSINNGMLVVSDLPPGDYDLLLKDRRTRIALHLTDGERREGYVLGPARQLELRGRQPLQIESIDVAEDRVKVRLQNASRFARLHVFATRFQPAYSAFTLLGRVRDAEPYLVTTTRAESVYVAGRNLGDEYRYILDRKYARKYPGNMLDRPSLLLNPWAVRKTETQEQLAELGEEFEGRGEGTGGGVGGRDEPKPEAMEQPADFSNLDFLAHTSAVLLNLTPNDDGIVEIERDELGPHQYVYCVAVDPQTTVYRALALPEVRSEFRDLRLAKGLDPKVHYTQQKQVSIVKQDEKLVLPDIATSKLEAYDSLPKLYSLYATLSGDPKLIEFNFILSWHSLKSDEKQTRYSKYACHELNFFLYKKDPQFFEEVVQPYLHNKKDKTFLDRWLLGDDLSQFLEPWHYARLNTVERILLAQRIAGEASNTARDIDDRHALVPADSQSLSRLFDTALKGSALDTSDALGLTEAQIKATPDVMLGTTLNSAQIHRLYAGVAESMAAPAPPAAPDLAARESERGALSKRLAERSAGEKRKQTESGKDGVDAFFFEHDAERLGRVRQYYQKLDKTQEWAENNYYQLPIVQQNAELITVNAFWRDYAHRDPTQPFYSTHLAEASHNFPEMMFALSLLDLPLEAAKHKTDFDAATMTVAAASPMVVFHEQIKQAQPASDKTPILVSQNFFRYGAIRDPLDPQTEKYITGEFLVHTVYGCQVVVTNPTSSPQKLDVLVQIPAGALAVLNSHETRSVQINLEPYHTQTVTYHFYFPSAGQYPHYPVQVASKEQLIASAEPVTLTVVEQPSQIDRQSWQYVSQLGSSVELLEYLRQHNLHRIELEKIAFRMSDKQFFEQVTQLLATRHVYNHTLWSYAIKHDVASAVRQYLQHADGFVSQCGSYLESPLLVIDPVQRHTYQHLDYRPLVNARAHQLGRQRQILNDRFHEQYHQLLTTLCYRRQLDEQDLMSVTYYLLLQDRIEEALDFFHRVNPQKLATRLQYDYFTAYLDLYSADPQLARPIAEQYANYSVDRWRNAFVSVIGQLDEIQGRSAVLVDREDRSQVQSQLAATEPSFDFQVESKQVRLDYQNLDYVQVNYYLMDIELLFSQNPFVQQYASQFSQIRPNAEQTFKLPREQTKFVFELPEPLQNRNVLVEIIGSGQTKSQAYYSNSLNVQVIENYGQIRVTHGQQPRPVPKVYVKVYGQMQDGSVQFYKDGYTDLRGRFDYTSLNTNELDYVNKFSLLILSEDFGAVVREAASPKR